MEDLTGYLVAIGAILVCLGFTLLALLVYSGLFENVTVGAGPPPIGEVFVAYRFSRGPYKEAGQIFTELTHLAPDNKCLGIYYDDPKRVPSHLTRFVVGSILAYDDQEVDPDMKKKFEENGYKFMRLPKVTNVVKTSFPHISSFSIFIAIFKVYPLMGDYVQDNKLCAHPFLEVYDGKTIHFMAPLAKQDEFYLPEMKKMGPDGLVIMEPSEQLPIDSYTNSAPVPEIPEPVEEDTNEADALISEINSNTEDMNGADSEASTGSSFEELKLDGDDQRKEKAHSPDSTTV
ncbi:testis-expressed protein 264 homolog [Patella vulgata]|uniref:testis-expressed protein 264 homolog n=1 Tax=Patella vulgata TaxID=6465 RepID=UPI00217F6082|nr:testis-expressed protein 264 homolog [Patella vulgata]